VSTTGAVPHSEQRASANWVEALRAGGAVQDDATARLHALLMRAARFEVARRKAGLAHLRGEELDEIATQCADDALMAVLRKLDDFRGESRFTTWAYKFALLEAAVALRRRAWQARELPVEPERWPELGGQRSSLEADVEQRELLAALRRAVDTELTPHQREVLVAVALNGVPIDVLAERLGSTRGALYKTIHDARRKLRGRLEAEGHLP
jgi:RNA polymerase sigma-70 factor, ECF subfamily